MTDFYRSLAKRYASRLQLGLKKSKLKRLKNEILIGQLGIILPLLFLYNDAEKFNWEIPHQTERALERKGIIIRKFLPKLDWHAIAVDGNILIFESNNLDEDTKECIRLLCGQIHESLKLQHRQSSK